MCVVGVCIVVFLVFHIRVAVVPQTRNNNNRELMMVNDCFDDCVRNGSRHAHTKSLKQIYVSVCGVSYTYEPKKHGK